MVFDFRTVIFTNLLNSLILFLLGKPMNDDESLVENGSMKDKKSNEEA